MGFLGAALRRVVCCAVALSLCLHLALPPCPAFGIAAPLLPAGLVLSQFAGYLLPVLAGALTGAAVVGAEAYALLNPDDFIGNDAVPANRAFVDELYSQYQSNGSVSFSGSDIPSSVAQSIASGANAIIGTYSVPFPLSYVLENAKGQSLIDRAAEYSAMVPSFGVVQSPIYYVIKSDAGSSVVYTFCILCSAVESSNFLNFSFPDSGSGSNRPSVIVNGSGRYLFASAVSSGFPVAAYISVSSSGAYSVAHTASPNTASSWSGAVTYTNTSVALSRYAADFVTLSHSSAGWDVSAPSVSDLPSAVSGIKAGLQAGTMTVNQAASAGLQAVSGKTIVVPEVITTYESIVVDSSGSGEGSGEGSGSIDLSGLEAIAQAILGSLGVGGSIVTSIGAISSAITGLPGQIAAQLFNTSVQSFGTSALDALDDLFDTYVSAIPTWLADNLIPPITAIPRAIGDLIIPPIQAINTYLGSNVIPPITAIPQAIGNLLIPPITGVTTWLTDNLIPPITAISDWWDTLPGIIGGVGTTILDGLSSLDLDIDLSAVISGIGSIPLSIASALGLDWWIEQLDDLDDRLDWEAPSSIVLPSASWADLTSVGHEVLAFSPLSPIETGINGVFAVFAGNGSSRAPRYVIDFPRPDGGVWSFVVDFALFDGQFVAVCHGVFYILFGFWLVGFIQRSKDRFDSWIPAVRESQGLEV